MKNNRNYTLIQIFNYFFSKSTPRPKGKGALTNAQFKSHILRQEERSTLMVPRNGII
jgi:hypothetical protein